VDAVLAGHIVGSCHDTTPFLRGADDDGLANQLGAIQLLD
jgi:hypothetical protein